MTVIKFNEFRSGNFAGKVTIEHTGIIYDCDLFKRRDGSSYLRPPTFKRTNDLGDDEYVQLVTFASGRKAKSWQKAAQKALKEYQDNN